MNRNFKIFRKKLVSLLLMSTIVISNFSYIFADSAKVVTLGADLSDKQKETMLNYFGVKENEAMVLEVNNKEEREYLEGIASNSQIGNKTFSCAYVEPTKEGSGINVKTANITWVSASMVATTLSTAGMTDANVVIAANFPVSGTGALTGIMKAFEDATGDTLDEEKKEIATEELVITGELGENIETKSEDDKVAQDKATAIINDIKLEVIKNNTKDTIQIAETINNVTNNYGITLTDEQIDKIISLMEKVANQNYDYNKMKTVLEDVKKSANERLDEVGEGVKQGIFDGFKEVFNGIGESIVGIFNDNKDEIAAVGAGILSQTNDAILGENVLVDATDKTTIELPTAEEAEGFIKKTINWFKELLGLEPVEENFPSDNVEDVIPESEEVIPEGEVENNEENLNEDIKPEDTLNNETLEENNTNENKKEDK